MKHHPQYAPSSWWRIWCCAGSVALIATRKPLPTPEDAGAARGTKLHERVRSRDLSGLSPYDAQAVKRALRIVDLELLSGGRAEWEVEIPISRKSGYKLSPPGSPPIIGTTDVVIDTGERATSLDWKFHGDGTLPAGPAEWQLAAYGIGLLQSRPGLRVVSVRAVACSSGHELAFELDRESMIPWVEAAEKLVKRSRRAEASLNAGPWCHYCPALTYCPEATRMRERLTLDALPFISPAGELRQENQAARWLREARVAERQLREGRATLRRLVEDRDDSEGVLRVESQAVRAFKHPPKLSDFPEEVSSLLTHEDVAAATTVSVSQLEATFAARCELEDREAYEDALRRFRKATRGMIETSERKVLKIHE